MISNKGRVEVTAYLHCRLDYCNAILAETADVVIKRLISSEYRGSLSGTIFRDQYHYFTQPTLASGVVQNRFQGHVQSCLYLYKLYSTYRLKILEVVPEPGRPWLQTSAGYTMPKLQAQHPPIPRLYLPLLGPRFSRLWRSAFPFLFVYDSNTAHWIEE